MNDLIIIGGGPAACAAGVYAARKLLKTVLITENFGGQSAVSVDIQNWIGTPHISGADLAKNLEAHVREYAGEVLSIEAGLRVAKLEKIAGGFEVTRTDETKFQAKAVLIASGGDRRRLAVPGANEFEHKGLTYCASCDGPLFSGQDVVVVGGGNAGFETAAQLLAYCKTVTLLQSRNEFVADPSTVAAVTKHPNMKALTGVKIKEVHGNKFVTGITFEKDGADQTLNVAGIFVEIGLMPSTGYANGVVELDPVGRVVVDPSNGRTNTAGIWAAGDCTTLPYHQNNIAAGDAVRALEDIYLSLRA